MEINKSIIVEIDKKDMLSFIKYVFSKKYILPQDIETFDGQIDIDDLRDIVFNFNGETHTINGNDKFEITVPVNYFPTKNIA